MATIQDVIEEMRTIQEAQVGLKTFLFDKIYAVNEKADLDYPALLVDDTPTFTPIRFSSGQTRWELRLHFLDTYHQDDEEVNTPEAKYAQLNQLAWEYVQEFERRSDLTPNSGWKVRMDETAGGTTGRDLFNARLVQVVIPLDVMVNGDCVKGTFNY